MRIGLIAALRPSADGIARTELTFAGSSVLARQASLLLALGVERVVCLTAGPSPEVLRLHHQVEAGGASFHALTSFAALPALVRAEDDLIILADGLVPDVDAVQRLLGSAGPVPRTVAAIPAEHPLASAHPEDFERIDAARHWAGVLVMRGAGAAQLADFPADADAISVLLRVALQAGTPIRDLDLHEARPEAWLLADNQTALAEAQQAMIARGLSAINWRAPGTTLAMIAVRVLATKTLSQRGRWAAGIGWAALVIAVVSAAYGTATGGLALAAAGAFAGEVAAGLTALKRRLKGPRDDAPGRSGGAPTAGALRDGLVSLTLWFALAPFPDWQPLAVIGPVVIGLVRLVAHDPRQALAATAADRAALLLALALASGIGVLPELLACLALGLVSALLLRASKD